MDIPTRERLVHALHEAAELEHNLMCTYLFAAFSLKGPGEGLAPADEAMVQGWRNAILRVAIEEMGHLTMVWNITAALGAAPRFGRDNFPLFPGTQPASVIVRLAPFSEAVIQHFLFLERPRTSAEPDGAGFVPEVMFKRGVAHPRLTPMGYDYETIGAFYAGLDTSLRAFVDRNGENTAFCGDPALQLSSTETDLVGTKPVICIKTASAALGAIIEQGEGAPDESAHSHFERFRAIREQLAARRKQDPQFAPAFPSAHNPVLRPPVVHPEGRVWIEDELSAETVDLANTAYALMLRLLGYAYTLARPDPMKQLVVDLAIGAMHAFAYLGERAARMPAGPSNPQCNAGVTFTTLRDAAPLLPGASAKQFFTERFAEIAEVAARLDTGDDRVSRARRMFDDLAARAKRGFATHLPVAQPKAVAAPAPASAAKPPEPEVKDGIERVRGDKLTVIYEGKKCIHSRHCVTWGPTAFLANVEGPWIHPDAVDVEAMVRIAHVCPSGAIRYERHDGGLEEQPPDVNLIAVREAGPYAVRADIHLDGQPAHYRATLCRCGGSKSKPFCDNTHKENGFNATGEPPTTADTAMLPVRNGVLDIEPELDGPLHVRGNLEITSGTGRVVARVTRTKLCRCGGSANKPFCDNTHKVNGFRS